MQAVASVEPTNGLRWPGAMGVRFDDLAVLSIGGAGVSPVP
jgi:hypothetical protein